MKKIFFIVFSVLAVLMNVCSENCKSCSRVFNWWDNDSGIVKFSYFPYVFSVLATIYLSQLFSPFIKKIALILAVILLFFILISIGYWMYVYFFVGLDLSIYFCLSFFYLVYGTIVYFNADWHTK